MKKWNAPMVEELNVAMTENGEKVGLSEVDYTNKWLTGYHKYQRS